MKRLAAWTAKHTIKAADAQPFYWMKGYFYLPPQPQGEVMLQQNLQEVITREYFFEPFGDVKGRRLLDIGCGAGDYMALMAELGGEVSGVDINEKQIEKGRGVFAANGLKGDFHLADVRALPFADETFDIIYSADVFEHISLEVKQAAMHEIYRVLKPGGMVIIKTPNLDYLRVTIMLRRLFNLLRLKSPFVYIEHTRNNPDNEHHGLTTYRELNGVFSQGLFLEPRVTHVPLRRGPLFISANWRFPGRKLFNECIIVSYRKSVFLPVSERMAKRAMADAAASPTLRQAAGTSR